MAAFVRHIDGRAVGIGIYCRAVNLFGRHPPDHSMQWSSQDFSMHTAGLSVGAPPHWDPIQYFTSSAYRTGVKLGATNLAFALGLSVLEKRRDMELRPFIKGRSYRSSLDTFPTNLFGSLQAVIHPPHARRGSRDNFVTHFNASGLFSPIGADSVDFLERGSETSGGTIFRFLLNEEDGQLSYGAHHNFPFDPNGAGMSFFGEANVDLLACLRFWKANPSALRYGSGYPRYEFSEVSGLSWEISDLKLTVFYHLHSGWQDRNLDPNRKIGIEGDWDCKLVFTLVRTGTLSPDPTYENQFLVGYSASQKYSYRLISGKSFFWHPDIDDGRLQMIVQGAYHGTYDSLENPLAAFTSGPFYGGSGDAYSKALSLVMAHGYFWNDQRNHLAGSAVYALHNAINSFLQILQNNYLEFFSEVDGLPALVPDIKPIIRFFTELSKKRFAEALRTLGDTVASNHLLWNFGIAPDLRIVEELNRLGPRLHEAFLHEKYPQPGSFHGAFVYKFDQKEIVPYSGSVLSTRTVSDIVAPKDSFSLALYRAYGAGVLPSLANLWAVKSMSFVIDWFTNVGQRLRAVDLSIIAFMLQIDFTTVSHTVTTEASGVQQSDFNNQMFDLIYYVRIPTQHVPGLLFSKYDFMKARGPDLGLLGALIWIFLPK